MAEQISLIEFIKGVILIVLGASIGLLAPVISERINKRKRKQALKYDLIDTLYLFFNWRKNQMTKMNHFLMIKRLKQIADNEYFTKKNLTSESQEDLFELRRFYTDEQRIINSDLEKSFEHILKLEAKLLTIISETKDIISVKMYLDVKRLMKPLIDASNISNEEKLYDYENLDKDRAKSVSKTLPEELFKATREHQRQCDQLIIEIESIFSNY